ncbi:hypothetical protein FPZ24_14510 [Sphingomonas panacisoli]|uniref:Uncharacterized protein n=1 Tax=Sphingomonas panacisoli TaxID=1813879 RepID=A0A5B8LK65_9SPHN|nr:hypothetical protein [Sphingomonas panacisoli]QDZ08531.1 hypothetical protein FPZ24_14510 [Sphingomonas panacisoli]
MPRGYRCIILAAFGWLILAAAPGKDRQPQSDNASASREAQSGLDKIAAAIKEANKSPQPDPGCDPDKEDRHSDLCAQWKAADAARDSFWAGVTGLVIGGFTLLAAGFAAWYARQAWKETKRGADAAELAVEAARLIGEAQTRAYLSVISLKGERSKRGLVFSAEVQNSGQSPALSAQVMLDIVDPDGNELRVLPEQEHQIAAQSTDDMAYCYFNRVEAREWTGIVVRVTVAYADVFERLHKVRATFAGTLDHWTETEWSELTKGVHVASYLRAERDSESTANDGDGQPAKG